jgi:hypothetical protein
VPVQISRLSSLSYLSLSNNHITLLPDSLLHLTRLKTLLMDHTEVQSLPAIVRLPDINLVSLRQTPFTFVSIELLPLVDKIMWDSKVGGVLFSAFAHWCLVCFFFFFFSPCTLNFVGNHSLLPSRGYGPCPLGYPLCGICAPRWCFAP